MPANGLSTGHAIRTGNRAIGSDRGGAGDDRPRAGARGQRPDWSRLGRGTLRSAEDQPRLSLSETSGRASCIEGDKEGAVQGRPPHRGYQLLAQKAAGDRLSNLLHAPKPPSIGASRLSDRRLQRSQRPEARRKLPSRRARSGVRPASRVAWTLTRTDQRSNGIHATLPFSTCALELGERGIHLVTDRHRLSTNSC